MESIIFFGLTGHLFCLTLYLVPLLLRCKILQEEAVHEDVAATYLAQQNSLSGVVQEA